MNYFANSVLIKLNSLIPGWCYLTVDIEFLTGVKLPYFWVATWWFTPVLFIGVTGWWLRALLRISWGNGLTLWPLLAVFVVILVVMVMLAAVAVAKEEQFNLVTVSRFVFTYLSERRRFTALLVYQQSLHTKRIAVPPV